jgi:hypothetical protein
MTKQLDDDQFEWINGKQVLKDGARARVSLMDSNSLQRGVALNLHDGRGGAPGRRNGYAFSRDATMREEITRAYSSYDDAITGAWKNPTSVGENVEPDDLHRSVDDHAMTMDQIYAAADAALREQWRNPR